jgi:hypothetical protein
MWFWVTQLSDDKEIKILLLVQKQLFQQQFLKKIWLSITPS